MKIVVLDGFTLNPGDLSWDALRDLGECQIYDRTPAEEVLARADGAEIILTNKTVLTAATIGSLPALRYIGVLATGYNVVDLAAARERKIPVTNVPGYGTRSVAQMTFALLLELAHRTGHHAQAVREGRWSSSPDFCFWDHPLIELEGLTLGLIGYGQIGRAVATLGRAFGMRVQVHTRSQPASEEGTFVDLDTLFRSSDVISLHCPLTPETRHLINADRLRQMKRSAFLLNTSRGPLIDESALAAALHEGRLAGAALDVLEREPPPAQHPLFSAPNCVITPHIAWATRAARSRLMSIALSNLRAFLAGQPQNVVSEVS
jgi:glycerate dehydrogenase